LSWFPFFFSCFVEYRFQILHKTSHFFEFEKMKIYFIWTCNANKERESRQLSRKTNKKSNKWNENKAIKWRKKYRISQIK
jgi:hypothetical protein